MKYFSHRIIFMILFISLLLPMQSIFARDMQFDSKANGRILVSNNFDYTKKNVAISIELRLSYDQILFQEILAQELMSNGYTVIERVQFDKILHELAMDQTGLVKEKEQSTKEAINRDGKEPVKKEFTKGDLKKLGEVLGISHMIFFGLVDDYYAYIRIVNLETAEIVVSAFINGIAKREDIRNPVIIRSIVKAIAASQKITKAASAKDISVNYFANKTLFDKFVEGNQHKEVIYQEITGEPYVVVYVN